MRFNIVRPLHGALLAASTMLTACGFVVDEIFPPPPPAPAVVTVAAADLASARSSHTATLLGTGKVLATGGWSGTASLASAELYDLTGNTWIAAGSNAAARHSHTATLLPNGRVLVTGGRSSTAALSSVEVYEPTGSSWSAAGGLAAARYLHTATLLPSGKVLVAGGFDANRSVLASAELYDPTTDTWAAAGSLAMPRTYHSATLLADGRVLVAGGAAGDPFGSLGTSGSTPYASVELYDPTTNAWTAAASLVTARGAHTATLLSNGKVLVAGGAASHIVDSAELYDPAGDAWTPAVILINSRALHTATRLLNGKVLLTGGEGDTPILGVYRLLSSMELYDPATNTWLDAGHMLAAYRYSHTATLLWSGKVLLAGGNGNGPNGVVANAELY